MMTNFVPIAGECAARRDRQCAGKRHGAGDIQRIDPIGPDVPSPTLNVVPATSEKLPVDRAPVTVPLPGATMDAPLVVTVPTLPTPPNVPVKATLTLPVCVPLITNVPALRQLSPGVGIVLGKRLRSISDF